MSPSVANLNGIRHFHKPQFPSNGWQSILAARLITLFNLVRCTPVLCTNSNVFRNIWRHKQFAIARTFVFVINIFL